MDLNLRTFSAMLSDAATAVQASATALLNLTPGSALRAILEANASLGMYLQSVFYNVLLTTRLATSGGTDADSFGADFGFSRLPASASTGAVTFGRYSTTTAALISPGIEVTTLDNLTSFQVIADTTNPLWSISQNAYVLPITVASGTVLVQCESSGAQGNVGVGVIGNIASVAPGLDTVVNLAAITNGADAESDASFRSRFVLYIQSRSRATFAAIGYAINSVEQGLSYSIEENVDVAGNWLPGNLVITVDDGSGTPSSDLLVRIGAAIELYRAASISYNLLPPSIVAVTVVLRLIPKTNFRFAQIVGPVEDAVSAYINALAVGDDLAYSRLAQVIYDSTDGIANVLGLTLNGATADILTTPRQVITTTSVVINP